MRGALQNAPIPPPDIMARTGSQLRGHDEEWLQREYVATGRARKKAIIRALPDEYSFEGKRVLDFGCGSGRVLRAFLPEAQSAEFWGCDLHAPTIRWLSENLSPPFQFFVNERPPLPQAAGMFDLVYALSVFTHITHEWSGWLVELHRLLKPGGLLLATFMGPATWERAARRQVDPDKLGMAVLGLHRALDETSGPIVLHSPWWLRSRWGRAFDIVKLKRAGFGQPGGHGFVLGRKRDVALAEEDLEWPDVNEQRELAAQREQLVLLQENMVELAQRLERQKARAEAAGRARSPKGRLRRLLARLGQRNNRVESTR